GKIGLGEVDFGAAHQGGDVAALEVLGEDLFMDSPKDSGCIDKILGAEPFAGGRKPSPSFIVSVSAAAFPPVPAGVVRLVGIIRVIRIESLIRVVGIEGLVGV